MALCPVEESFQWMLQELLMSTNEHKLDLPIE